MRIYQLEFTAEDESEELSLVEPVIVQESSSIDADDTLPESDSDTGYAPDVQEEPEASTPEENAALTAPLDGVTESLEEESVFGDAGEKIEDGALAVLGASLPVLLSDFSEERLNKVTQHLHIIREATQLSPVQTAAADMLETVIEALPKRTGQLDHSRAVLDCLYQALAQPQEHVPAATVSAYAEWVQSLLSETLLAETGAKPSKEYLTARDIYQELSDFRSHMEEELTQLRQEIRNR